MSDQALQTFNEQRFCDDLTAWYRENKRDLPWRKEKDPYKIWVSEIMLQQTRVDTVIPYFERFISLFPTPEALADAEEETVLKAWEGLGYYSRARNLQAAVREVSGTYGGRVPDTKKEVSSLKGVGPYTAGAILSIAYDKPEPAVDGNVMRVLSRNLAIYDDISKVGTRKRFEGIAESLVTRTVPSDFNQALMELGALICTPRSPSCLICPVQEHCRAREEGVQDLLPVKAKKKPPVAKSMKAAVIENGNGDILIERRPDTGLLAKLWQFPNCEDQSEDLSGIIEYLAGLGIPGVTAEEFTYVQHVRHVFSHIVWEIDVYKVKIPGSLPQDRDGLRWVKREDVDFFPFPVPHQKIIDYTLKGDMNE
ncbi:A/G-specific adenine glycosylase [Alteribacter natronophilus]|uniref:A/G-specific adenine glycosylase n=1 Tax=Alteribacter natronophilus TaxID=2583810 RepID=UPI00110D2D73|nr:A/G-specific adenine glycosylase [Alteribacter natronophilus]TMW70577.1 A/G-specific adenine glycosylase [Alteribacter natronophilus]